MTAKTTSTSSKRVGQVPLRKIAVRPFEGLFSAEFAAEVDMRAPFA